MNPLWYLGATFTPPPQVAVVGVGPGISRAQYVSFGRVLRAASVETGRKIAFVASADMAHRHAAGSRFGFAPAAAECDAAVVEAVRANALDRLLTFDEGWVERAATDAIEPLLALHGLMEGGNLHSDVLCYEVPT